MPISVAYENCNTYYFNAASNQMWCGTPNKQDLPDLYSQTTGWKYIPNQCWDNWLTPKQHFDLFTNHDKYIPVACEFVIQNMIPLNDQLAISQDTAFLSFNNTVYALGYCDDRYETIPKEARENLMWREGVSWKGESTSATIDAVQKLPDYIHYIPIYKTQQGNTILKGFAWDPFCAPSKLQELRPGKNAIGFKWSIHPSDKDKWQSTAFHFAAQTSGDSSNEPTINDMNFDIHYSWITPGSLIKQDPRSSYAKYRSEHYKYFWNYPIPMMFLKLMPLFDITKNTIINQYAQVVIVRKIVFEVTPRLNTTNFPQVASHWTVPVKWSDPAGTTVSMNYSPAWRPMDTIGQPPFSDSIDTILSEKTYRGGVTITHGEIETLSRERGGQLNLGVRIVPEKQTEEKKKAQGDYAKW